MTSQTELTPELIEALMRFAKVEKELTVTRKRVRQQMDEIAKKQGFESFDALLALAMAQHEMNSRTLQ